MQGDDRFLASLRNHGDFAIATMNVEDAVAAIPLGEDDLVFFVSVYAPAPVPACEKRLKIKRPFVFFHMRYEPHSSK
jgi:hypothetical protein